MPGTRLSSPFFNTQPAAKFRRRGYSKTSRWFLLPSTRFITALPGADVQLFGDGSEPRKIRAAQVRQQSAAMSNHF